MIIRSIVTREIFSWWLVNRVIPQLQPSIIIVIDNAAIHYGLGPEIEVILREVGLSIEFLPLYSPKYNPIKLTFYTLKQWVCKHFHALPQYANFEDFLL